MYIFANDCDIVGIVISHRGKPLRYVICPFQGRVVVVVRFIGRVKTLPWVMRPRWGHYGVRAPPSIGATVGAPMPNGHYFGGRPHR